MSRRKTEKKNTWKIEEPTLLQRKYSDIENKDESRKKNVFRKMCVEDTPNIDENEASISTMSNKKWSAQVKGKNNNERRLRKKNIIINNKRIYEAKCRNADDEHSISIDAEAGPSNKVYNLLTTLTKEKHWSCWLVRWDRLWYMNVLMRLYVCLYVDVDVKVGMSEGFVMHIPSHAMWTYVV